MPGVPPFNRSVYGNGLTALTARLRIPLGLNPTLGSDRWANQAKPEKSQKPGIHQLRRTHDKLLGIAILCEKTRSRLSNSCLRRTSPCRNSWPVSREPCQTISAGRHEGYRLGKSRA